MRRKKQAGCAAAIAVATLWGLSFIGSRRALAAGMQTFSLIAVRFTVASALLYCICRLTKQPLRLPKKDFLRMLVTAVTGVTLYYLCELRGLERTSASVTSLVIATIPVFSLLVGAVRYRKMPEPRKWLGVFLSLFGVYLLAFTEPGENTAAGFACLFGACACWVVYLEITGDLLTRYSSLTVTFWQSLLGTLTSLPLALTEKVPWRTIPLDAWLWTCVFLGMICSCACYIMNNYSIAVLSPQMNAAFLNLSPVATAIGGYILLGERITLTQAVGGAIILASLFIITFSGRKKRGNLS